MIAVVLCAAVLTGYYAYNYFMLSQMKQELAVIETELNNPEMMAKVSEYQAFKSRNDALGAYGVLVDSINAALDDVTIITSDYYEELNSALPQKVFMQSASAGTTSLTVQGVAADRTAVAEYIHNLKQLGLFYDVFVSNINQGGENASSVIFSLTCTVKGGAAR